MDKKRTDFFAPALMLAALFCAPTFATNAAVENPMNSIGIKYAGYQQCLLGKGPASASMSLRLVSESCGYDHGVTSEELVNIYKAVIETDPLKSVSARMASHEAVFTSAEFSFFAKGDSALSLARDAASADAAFARLEQEAMANLDIKSDTGQAILAGLSVARNSLKYWSGRSEKLSIERLRVVVGAAYFGGVIGDGGAGVAAATSNAAYYASSNR
jgi:hypothetical protein